MTWQPIIIEINGLVGQAKYTEFGAEFTGPWASHTGFLSDYAPERDTGDAGYLFAKAEELYNAHCKYAFAVGHEHSEHGWKTLERSWRGNITLRLPQWHRGVVAATLESYGMVFEGETQFQSRWSFPVDSGVTLEQAKAVLAPILKRNTRFTDEIELAAAIDAAARAEGFRYRAPLQEGLAQQTLF